MDKGVRRRGECEYCELVNHLKEEKEQLKQSINEVLEVTIKILKEMI